MLLTLLLFLSAAPVPARMYWIWELPLDLRQRPLHDAGVAFLLATAEQQEQKLIWRLRRQPLRLPPATFRMATIRLTVNPREGARRIDLAKERVAIAARMVAFVEQAGVPALQIDADIDPATTSAYLQLLADVRKRLPGIFLSVTANVSWCRPGTWVDRAPVDEVVPMLFVRGVPGEPVPSPELSPRCRPSIGLVPGRKPPPAWTRQRVYFFVTGLSDFAVLFPE